MRLAVLALVLAAAPAAADPALVAAARSQVGVTVIYDPAYVGLAFPMGDLPRDRGVCSDVIVRALRDGWGIDLQAAVNRDMKSAFAAYPALWGLRTTDRNIDHRRVPNLETFLKRQDAALPVTEEPADYQPGDVVAWNLRGRSGFLPHIGIVTDRLGPSGRPQVVHNIGAGPQLEDVLFAWPITGHYRWLPEPQSPES
jgi:uncharacterized protein YijF (DUF1287 family)